MIPASATRFGLSSLVIFAGGASAAYATPPREGTAITNTGEVSYVHPALGAIEVVKTNTVTSRVAARPDFSIDIDQVYRRAPGGAATFGFRVSNTGNTDITVQADFGNVRGDYNFVDTAGYVDLNGNGEVDAGEPGIDAPFDVPYGAQVSVLVDVLTPTTAQRGDTAAGDLTGVLIYPSSPPPSAARLAISSANAGPGGAVREQATGQVIIDERGLTLAKTASRGEARAGDEIVYSLRLRNNSNSALNPDQAFDGLPMQIDGTSDDVLMVSDAIPLHTRFTRVIDAADFTPVYQGFGDTELEWQTTPPENVADITAIGFMLGAPLPPGESRDFSFGVEVNDGTRGVTLVNQAEVWLPGAPGQFDPASSNRVTTPITGASGTIDFHGDDGFSATISDADFGDEVFLELVSGQCNATPQIDQAAITVSTTPEGDREIVIGIETGPNTGIFRSAALPVGEADPVLVGDGVLQGRRKSLASVNVECDPGLEAALTIAPAGVVFLSATNEPVPGARVDLIDAAGIVVQTTTTGPDGVFTLAPQSRGAARLRVTPPGAMTAPSQRLAYAGYGRNVDAAASFYQPFEVDVTGRNIVFDIPVDPNLSAALTLSKTSERTTARVGEAVTYDLELRNTSSIAIQASEITDTLPTGLNYLDGSARLDGQLLSNPRMSSRGDLVFDVGLLRISRQ